MYFRVANKNLIVAESRGLSPVILRPLLFCEVNFYPSLDLQSLIPVQRKDEVK